MNNAPSNTPCIVDLDGTLIHTDLLLESALMAIKHHIWILALMVYWLITGGKLRLKRELAARVEIDVAALPYNRALLNHLQPLRGNRPLVLATASHVRYAQQIAAHLGMFDAVFATDQVNLSGNRKAELLVEKFGAGKFVYAGNSIADVPVWAQSGGAILVNTSRAVDKKARACQENIVLTLKSPFSRVRSLVKALRPHQWVKNVLVLAPLFIAGEFTLGLDGTVAKALLAFGAFSLCASSVYLLNDLLDIEADRHHPTKRNRPFAAGALPITYGVLCAPLLFLSGVVVAVAVSPSVAVILVVYYALSNVYSLKLKRLLLVDVFVLSLLYTIRILAGVAIVSTLPSFWLFAFSIFLFVSLALLKRYSELMEIARVGAVDGAKGRGYHVADVKMLAAMGVAAGYASCLVFLLYISSDVALSHFKAPAFLWGTGFIFLYWISHMWMSATRGLVHDDPIVFALKNRSSLYAIIGALLFLAIAVLR